MSETKTLQLTDGEIALLYYMSGYSSWKLPKIFEEIYNSFMKKLEETAISIEEAEG